jgi:hypothetical protein
VLLPSWYGPGRNPTIPLVISPHGRNGTGKGNAEYWGRLPAIGTFAVVNPDGMGRRLGSKSYAYKGQIDDLAKMPTVVTRSLPWIRIDSSRIYALGSSSMGGQETALFLDRGQWLAKLLMVDKTLRLKSVPISLALPWGLNISDLLLHIPLPAKITIEVQDPIEVDADDQAVHEKVIASLQAGVDRLAAERRFPVIG